MTAANTLRVEAALKLVREERRMLRRASDAARQWRLDRVIELLERVEATTPEEDK